MIAVGGQLQSPYGLLTLAPLQKRDSMQDNNNTVSELNFPFEAVQKMEYISDMNERIVLIGALGQEEIEITIMKTVKFCE